MHEVHADDLVRALRLRTDPPDGYRGGIARQNDAGSAVPIEVLEDLDLERFVFRRGLDDEIRVRHVFDGHAPADPAKQGIPLFCRHGALCDHPGQPRGDRRDALVDKLFTDIVQDNAQAAGRRHLGDAAPHLARADHSEGLDIHAATSCGISYHECGILSSGFRSFSRSCRRNSAPLSAPQAPPQTGERKRIG